MARNIQKCKQGKRAKKPLDPARLRDMALHYVARYSTTSAKLSRYLQRKLYERGWPEDEPPPDIAALVSNYVELGYIDDEAFARTKSSSLLRRGYGARRVSQALHQDGVAAEIRDEVQAGEAQQRHAALAMAKKRRFGPFGRDMPEPDVKQKQIAAMLRAGHNLDGAKTMVHSASEKSAEEWAHELDEDEFDEAG